METVPNAVRKLVRSVYLALFAFVGLNGVSAKDVTSDLIPRIELKIYGDRQGNREGNVHRFEGEASLEGSGFTNVWIEAFSESQKVPTQTSFMVYSEEGFSRRTPLLRLEYSAFGVEHLRRFCAGWMARELGVEAPLFIAAHLVLDGRILGVFSCEEPSGVAPERQKSAPSSMGFQGKARPENRKLAWEVFCMKLGTPTGASQDLVRSATTFSWSAGPVFFVAAGETAQELMASAAGRRALLGQLEAACSQSIEKRLVTALEEHVSNLQLFVEGAYEDALLKTSFKQTVIDVTRRFQNVRMQVKTFGETPDKELKGTPLAQLSRGATISTDVRTSEVHSSVSEFRRCMSKVGGKTGSIPVRLHQFEIMEERLGSLNELAWRSTNSVKVRASIDGGSEMEAHIRLKGHSTRQSFRRKPSFSLEFMEEPSPGFFGGAHKASFHSALFEPSFLKEFTAWWLFQKAGVPCPEVAFAEVKINGVARGLFVMVEPTSKTFLRREFGNSDGVLAEGEHQEIGAGLEVKQGSSEDADTKLGHLRGVAQEAIKSGNLDQLSTLVDLQQLARFIASEAVLGHIEGYTMWTHNYRIYQSSSDRRFHLLPHGMDGILAYRWNASEFPEAKGVLAKALIGSEAGRRVYQKELFQVLQILDLDGLARDLASVCSRLETVLDRSEPFRLREQQQRTEALLADLAKRKEKFAAVLKTDSVSFPLRANNLPQTASHPLKP